MKMNRRLSLFSVMLTMMLLFGGMSGVCASADSISEDNTDSLVAYWPMDEGQGNVIEDKSGNGNDGTIIGGAKWIDGIHGKALEFNGVDSYVNCGNDTSLNISDKITVEAWVKLYSWEGGGVVSKYSGTGGGYFLCPCWREDALPYMFIRGFDDTGKVALSAAKGTYELELNEWHHLVATAKRGDRVKLYLDGVCVADTAAKAESFGNDIDNLLIGNYGGIFNGVIDEVKIYNRALSEDEFIGSQYSVTYDANGGNGTMMDSNSPYDAGSTVTVLDNSFSKENYTFSGWNEAADGTGISYAVGATFSLAANTTLYAQWTYSGDYSECLVANWPMDEGQGNVIEDKSGNSNDGTIIGGAKWIDGRFGKALEFNGVDSYVNCGNDASLNISDEITIEAWVKLYSLDGGGVVSKYSGTGGGYFLCPCWRDDSLPYMFIRGFDSTGKVALSAAVGTFELELNKWHYLLATAKRGDRVKIYLDGVCVANTAAKTESFGNDVEDLLMGKYMDDILNGAIDEVKIYNRAFSEDEIENMGVELFSAEEWNQTKNVIQSSLSQVNSLLGQNKNSTDGYLINIKNHVLDLMTRVNVFDGFSGYLTWKQVIELDNISQESLLIAKTIDSFKNNRIQGGDAYVFEKQSISNDRINPDAVYISDETAKKIKISASPGEYETTSLMVYAARDLDGMLLTATDLKHGNKVIPGENIDIGIVKWWYQSGDYSIIRFGKHFTPELILHDDSLVKVDETTGDNYVKLAYPEGNEYVNISGTGPLPGIGTPPSLSEFPVKDESSLKPTNIKNGENKQYWLTIKIPDDAAPGKYKGKIVLTEGGNPIEPSTIDLEVEVLPIKLSEPYYASSIYYRGYLDENGGTISSEAKSRQQLEAELRDMYEHGVINPLCYQPFDKALLGEYLAIRQEIGMKGPLYYLGFIPDRDVYPLAFTNSAGSENARQILVNRIKELSDLAKTYGINEVYIYGVDEATGSGLTAQRKCWEAIHDAGAKVFVTGYTDVNYSLMGDIQDVLIHNGKLSICESEAWHNNGHKIWSYANPQGGVEKPETYRRNYGLLLWQYDYDGACTYAYQNGSVGTLSWNDFEVGSSKYRHHNMTYPTIDGEIDTIQWEGYREGVDDVRYLTTLIEAIESAKASKNEETVEIAGYAEKYLAELKTEDLSTCNLDEIRSEIICYILKLNK